MKIIDGSARACTKIALSALAALGVDTTPADALATLPVLGGGRPVGVVRASLAIWDAARSNTKSNILSNT